MKKVRESEITLLINGLAGNGSATRRAEKVVAKFPNITSLTIEKTQQFSEEDWRQLLDATKVLCILGGDGTSFRVLSQLYAFRNLIPELPVVTALGSGGENVLAKAMNTIEDDIGVIFDVITNDFLLEELAPQLVSLDQEKADENIIEIPSFWSLHAGFSASVLKNIEDDRLRGVSDFQRRYISSLKQFIKLRRKNAVYVSTQTQNEVAMLEFGLIAGQLPWWTSKILLDQVAAQPIVSQIPLEALEQRSESAFFARLVLELLCLKLGLPIQRDIFQQRRTKENEEFVVCDTDSKNIAIDSEVYEASTASVTTSHRTQSGIFVVKR